MPRKISWFLTFTIILPICGCFKTFGQNKQQQLNALFDTLSRRQNFNGCVLISDRGKILLQSAYGVGSAGADPHLTNASRFEIGSITKAFTAIAIMQLKEKGLIRYDDTLTRFIPALPYPGVTIRHLLSNTSGIEDFLSWTESETGTSAEQSNASVIRKLSQRKTPPAFVPGQGFQYSNTNYLLLASIVERVTNMPFQQFLARNIFEPSGMENTSVYSRQMRPLPATYAYDYSWDGSRNRLVRTDSLKRYPRYMGGVKGAYGILTTTSDLLRWVRALTDHRLVGEPTFNEALAPFFIRDSTMVAEIFPGIPYAAGWSIISGDSIPKNIFSSGNYGGYTSLLARDFSNDRTVILLSNSNETTDVTDVMGHIDDVLEKGQLSFPVQKQPRKGIRLAAGQLRRYSGKYLTKGGNPHEFGIVFADNQLYGRFDRFTEQNLFPESDNVLFANGVTTRLVFRTGPDGKILGFTMTGSDLDRYFEKVE